jgi:RNA polymerase sigma factor (sigma-70 family)
MSERNAPSSNPHPESISFLLFRIRGGDMGAVERLLTQLEPEVRQWIRAERGRAIEAKFETVDLTQDFFLLFLKYLPNLKCTNEETLRRLLYRMIQNMVRDRGQFLNRELRRISKERPLASDTALDLDPPQGADATPSQLLDREHENALMRVGLALLPPADRELVVRHNFEGASYVELGKELGIEPDTCRMRCNRAMADLVKIVGRLRRGDVEKAIGGD